jgi:hypothetical protein
MAQTNFTPISLYYSATATNVPSAANLVAGELAINTQDGKLFYKDAAGVVQTIASKDVNSGTFTNISVSGVASFADGTVSLPSITNIGDTNTGIYFPAADTIAFTEGGVESMRIDSSGNVGIGTSSPLGKLEVRGSGNTALYLHTGNNSGDNSLIYFGDTGSATVGLLAYDHGTNAMTFHTNSGERMRITSAGDVGIGTNSPANYGAGYTTLKLNGSTSGVFDISTNNTRVLSAYYDSTTSAPWLTSITAVPLVFGTNGVERMRIDSSGNLLVGRTNSEGARIDAFNGSSTSGVIRLRNDNGGAQTFANFDYGGTVIGSITGNNTVTAYNVASDRRLKENIVPFNSGLSTVIALKPSQYNYISDKETTYQGFIADELQTVVPHAVTGEVNAVDEEGKPIYQGLDASFLIPHLVSAIQELNAKITALENK